MTKNSPVYNEPLLKRRNDWSPKLQQIGGMHPIIKARLELEKTLRMCGNDPEKPLKIKKTHVKVLLAMLSETDSPLSASLRARSAGIVGFMKIKEAAKILREMALKDDDIQTRLNAISSFIRISGYATKRDVQQLVKNNNKHIRVVTYIAAMRSSDKRLVEATELLYKKESDEDVRYMVTRRVPKLQSESTAKDNDSKS